ncbi:hypothetical protein F5I97DRAFT_1807822, partial [Phlebopus sp. FC_14]
QTSSERAEQAVPGGPETKSGQSQAPDVGPTSGPQPTPQRTRDDGTVYTKVNV